MPGTLDQGQAGGASLDLFQQLFDFAKTTPGAKAEQAQPQQLATQNPVLGNVITPQNPVQLPPPGPKPDAQSPTKAAPNAASAVGTQSQSQSQKQPDKANLTDIISAVGSAFDGGKQDTSNTAGKKMENIGKVVKMFAALFGG